MDLYHLPTGHCGGSSLTWIGYLVYNGNIESIVWLCLSLVQKMIGNTQTRQSTSHNGHSTSRTRIMERKIAAALKRRVELLMRCDEAVGATEFSESKSTDECHTKDSFPLESDQRILPPWFRLIMMGAFTFHGLNGT